MNNLIDRFTSLFKPAAFIPVGVYHYQSPPDGELQYRLHLRVGENGEGLLIINASTILHLNLTATEYAYHLIKDTPTEEVVRIIASRYQINRNDARMDFGEVKHKIHTMLEVPDLDPVSFLDISREDPYSGAATAPYRLDCALTYQLPDTINPELAPVRRVDRELTTEEWLSIIDKAWKAGIPHLIFTGGEPTLREDLIRLISHAEKNGQVTGLLSDGYKLRNDQFRHDLLQSGLDHLLFLLNPTDNDSWDSLQAILNEDLFTTVHLTITPKIVPGLSQILGKCKKIGANAISLSTNSPGDRQLTQAMSTAQTLAADLDLPLKWELPVPYSDHNPISVEMERSEESANGSGKAWFYVEPDGDVLPGQGINQVLGNLLQNNWDEIWQKPIKE
ncbi:MAG: radical SAM protein [Anaerolineales bacterium]|nr:radical SAM protein [Anaerolineales bacterium]